MNNEKLIKILETQTTTYRQFRMFAFIVREVKSIPGCVLYSHKGNLYIRKGNCRNYPCVVAHMDTVHDIGEDLIAITLDNKVTGFNRFTMQQTGIGGDDKVGIFIALECLRFFDNIKVAFFRDEETGCEGSFDADISFFEDCTLVLQCDRQGNSDFIVESAGVTLSSEKFQTAIHKLIKSFDYSFDFGMLTDVAALKQLRIDCSMANISCGYYNPHTSHEYVILDDVQNCLNLVKCIIHEIGHIKYKHTYKRPGKFNFSSYFWHNDQDPYCRDCWQPGATATGYCQQCNQYYELI